MESSFIVLTNPVGERSACSLSSCDPIFGARDSDPRYPLRQHANRSGLSLSPPFSSPKENDEEEESIDVLCALTGIAATADGFWFHCGNVSIRGALNDATTHRRIGNIGLLVHVHCAVNSASRWFIGRHFLQLGYSASRLFHPIGRTLCIPMCTHHASLPSGTLDV